MPWDAASFSHHNHSLTPAQSDHAARIANAILKKSGDEGMAIATANKMVHRDDGGMVPAQDQSSLISGLQPSTQPPINDMVQRFAALPPEQLQAMIPGLGNSQAAMIARRILAQKRVGIQTPATTAPQIGAYPAAAMSAGMYPRASGGSTPHMHSGTVPILAAGGEFIIAPHHVQRLGKGDTAAGHKWLDQWVVAAREEIIKTMSKLKPPVKS